MSDHSLLRQALLLDTETTGLARGSGVHELAIYNLSAQELHEYYIKPNLVKTQTNPLQEHTRLASSPMDVHIGVKADRWTDILRAQLHMENRVQEHADRKEVMRALRASNPFLYRAIKEGKHPHLEGDLDPSYLRARERALAERTPGLIARSSEATIDEVLSKGGILDRALRSASRTEGATVWIANAAFEAKQLGAQLGAMEERHGQSIKGVLETQTKSHDAFYVTGEEVNLARMKAQLDGDWTRVYKAYKTYTPKAGEVAVRDIQDVLRAMTSYAKKVGITSIKDPYLGTSMDVSARIFGSIDADPTKGIAALKRKEVHKAAEDLIETEAMVLQKSVKYTDALEAVAGDGPLGRQLIEQAKERKGALWEAAQYYARLEVLEPTLREQNLIKRLGRAQEDFIKQEKTYQRTGTSGISWMEQGTPSGGMAKVGRLVHERSPFSSWDSVLEFLEQEGRYEGLDIRGIAAEMQGAVKGKTQIERLDSLSAHIESKTAGVIDAKIAASADVIYQAENRHLGALVSRWGQAGRAVGYAADALQQMDVPKAAGRWGAAVAGLAVAGVGWNMVTGNRIEQYNEPSLVSFDYYEWLKRQQDQKAQAEFSGNRPVADHMQGMGHDGLAGFWRSINTDFGSPYMGIQGSQLVFHNQELLAERERWIRENYIYRHFNPDDGLFGAFGPFRDHIPKGYNLMGTGNKVNPHTHAALQNAHKLLELDLTKGNWKIKVDDVDTIMIQRGGVVGALQSFFGQNKRYTFRLEGIDSTEVTHGAFSSDAGQYHAPQPFAGEAADAMKQMLANKKMKIIYNPTDSSYGRQLGVVYADGKNMNIEAVKRGYAAFLPYNKREEAIIDWNALEKAQAGAMASGRGMWSQPWAQVYGEFYNAGHNSITFNTFTRKDRIVKNRTTMDLLTLMEHAQSQGFMSTSAAMEAQRLGTSYDPHDPDAKKLAPSFHHAPPAHYNAYMAEMMQDLSQWNRTHGTGQNQNRFRSKGNYGKLDSSLALDSMGSTDSIWNKRRLKMFEKYAGGRGDLRARRAQQAAMQRQLNHNMFNSHVNHHTM